MTGTGGNPNLGREVPISGISVRLVIVAIILLVAVPLFLFSKGEEPRIVLVPSQKVPVTRSDVEGTVVGTGWSVDENATMAVQEAISMALEGKSDTSPDLAIIFASSGSDIEAIVATAREILGESTKLYGGSSDSRAVMTDKGFVRANGDGEATSQRGWNGALAIMTISSKDIVFGVGSADFTTYTSVQEAARTALLAAMKSAGRTQDDLPKAILLTPTNSVEEEVLEGIENVIGKDKSVLGGTAGGPALVVIGDKGIYENGVSLAVIYTDLPIGITFEGGFNVKGPHSGIVTRVDKQEVIEIDGRPALDVYDEWLGGSIGRLYEEYENPNKVKDLLTLQPLYRKYSSPDGQEYFLFSHPWPKDPTQNERSIMTSTKIGAGERLYLSHGTWETLVNRVGNLPKNAKDHGGIDINEKPVLAIGYICAGVMGSIPDTERDNLPVLINHANHDAPLISTFTWGEQGHFPGIGNKHGNLLTSLLIIGRGG